MKGPERIIQKLGQDREIKDSLRSTLITPHPLDDVEGIIAELFAKEQGLEIVDPKYFWTQERWDQLQRAKEKDRLQLDHDAPAKSGSLADINSALAGLAYKPAANFTGADTLTFTTSDDGHTGSGGALTATQTVAISVDDVPPVIANVLADASFSDGAAGIAIDAAAGFASPAGLPLTFTATGLPDGLAIDSATGQITGSIDHDASIHAPSTSGSGATLTGTYTVLVTADDGHGGTVSQTFTIEATNEAPYLASPFGGASSVVGATVSVDVGSAFGDLNIGDQLAFAATGLPLGLSIDPTTGVISGKIADTASTGSHPFTVTVTDDKGASTAEAFAWTVGLAAPAASIAANTDGTLTVTGTGVPGDTIAVSFADGSQVTTTITVVGTWLVSSAVPQTSGDVTATQHDASGTTSPTTITAGLVTPTRDALSTIDSSVPIVVRWSSAYARSTMATGVDAGRPRADSVVTSSGSRPTPISTTSVSSVRANGSRSPSSCPVTTTKPVASPRCVTGMPAAAGAATALVTPGTTSTGIPASAHARTSSDPRPRRKGSPPLRRATRSPRWARSTISALISSCDRACAFGDLPASMTSTSGSRIASRSVGASRSWTTTSADSRARRPRTVIRSPSPGPPPMRTTLPPGRRR